mmetsp:Transcript_28852/g.39850  ORF Transcript_28852/g.39850 Transcript_28852/m.39850 type:complete len:285 (+) Transcript_28852:322-1176(+)
MLNSFIICFLRMANQRTHVTSSEDLVAVEREKAEPFVKLQQQVKEQRTQLQHELGTRRARAILIIVPLALFVWAMADDYLQHDDEGAIMEILHNSAKNTSLVVSSKSLGPLDASNLMAGLKLDFDGDGTPQKGSGRKIRGASARKRGMLGRDPEVERETEAVGEKEKERGTRREPARAGERRGEQDEPEKEGSSAGLESATDIKVIELLGARKPESAGARRISSGSGAGQRMNPWRAVGSPRGTEDRSNVAPNAHRRRGFHRTAMQGMQRRSQRGIRRFAPGQT